MRSINNGPSSASFAFHIGQYLLRRGDAAVTDWASLNGRSKYYNENRTNAMKNWEAKMDLASEGITQDVKMREVMRLVRKPRTLVSPQPSSEATTSRARVMSSLRPFSGVTPTSWTPKICSAP